MITQRDLTTLLFIGEMGAINYDHLVNILQVSDRQMRRIVDRWEREGLVERAKIVSWQRHWIWLTKRCLTEVGLPYKGGNPVPANALNHQYQVVDLAIRLQQTFGDAVRDWKGERSLKGVAETYQYYPDLRCEMRFNGIEWHPVVIEVELHKKAIDDKIRTLKAAYPILYYYVNDATRQWVLDARDRLATEGIDFGIYDIATLHKCP